MKQLNTIINIILLTSLFLSSCKVLSPTVMFQNTEETSTSKEIISNNAKIAPNDQLDIIVATNKGQSLLDLSMYMMDKSVSSTQVNSAKITYLVEPDSLVKIPTLGRIKLGGMTIREAEKELEQLLSENYKDPFVKILITNRKATIFFEEGTKGSIITLPEERMSLIEAIATSGGLTENSKSYKIKILRSNYGNWDVYTFNIRNVSQFSKANIYIEAGDIIYVDTRPRYLRKILNELQPYLVLISSGILVYTIFNK
ncbi:MAG: polysaccharide biosynthesis/export family protein [Bacteroidales bacterium]